MANVTSRTSKKDERFFKALAGQGFITKACEVAGYRRASVYEWRDADAFFGARWKDAQEEYKEKLEREADRRAVEGDKKAVWYQGRKVGEVRDYSDSLLMFRLKALDPDRYKDRAEHSHKGGVSARIIVETGVPGVPGSADGQS